jgi:pimeloyl-ACP methyl ester carboxylesterase
VCVYDRAGLPMGESDARPPGVAPTAQRFSLELRTLLANAGEQGPYVLVGASFGGVLLTSFTLRYPGEVAGLVFLDAAAPSPVGTFPPSGVYGEPEPWDGSADLSALAALTFGSRPVVVLEADLTADAADFARRSPVRLHARVPTSHFILVDAPYFGLEATRLVVAAARPGGALPACAQTQLPRYGAGCR